MALPTGQYWYVSGSVTLGVWAKKAGTWVLITTVYIEIAQEVPGSGNRTVPWAIQQAFNLGPGVEAFGVSVYSFEGVSALVADFVSAQWSATASSGERSATPAGQLSTAVVSPQ